jgi:hypothetical protein
MADFISDLASKVGISPEQAQRGLGTVLAFLKSSLPEDAFSKVESAVPGANSLMTSAEAVKESAGGIIGAVTSMAGKLFGEGSGAMLSKLTHIGLSADQIKSFVPRVLEFLKSKLPADVMKQVTALIPGGGGS